MLPERLPINSKYCINPRFGRHANFAKSAYSCNIFSCLKFRSNHCSIKKVFLKALQLVQFYNFAKFLRKSFLQNTYGQLLLQLLLWVHQETKQGLTEEMYATFQSPLLVSFVLLDTAKNSWYYWHLRVIQWKIHCRLRNDIDHLVELRH